MNIKALIDRGLALRRAMKRLKKDLDAIEEKLADVGLYLEQVELKDPDREGRRYLAKGTRFVVPVIFTADKLLGSFKANTPKHRQILAASDHHLASFYTLTETYESVIDDGKRFRAVAGEILGPKAPAFITACLARDKHGIPKSDSKVAWDDAEPVEAK